MKINGYPIVLQLTSYFKAPTQTAVILHTPTLMDGQEIMENYDTATVCVPSIILQPGEIILRNHDYHEPVFRFMIDNGFVKEPHRAITSGFVQLQVCRKTPLFTQMEENNKNKLVWNKADIDDLRKKLE